MQISTADYGSSVGLDGTRRMRWYPLAHPGATRAGRPYHAAHEAWIKGVEST